ncbi:hypothetical protein AYI69_g157 [Smittium culicis]|uniref:Uncharacterized protein n=1 Tax=Smittium culicis TaxID=133412 RepID=A0A1R1YTW7_9FUNG|nr:hypothetical protein AYI69_g157 [Smittium culicis]
MAGRADKCMEQFPNDAETSGPKRARICHNGCFWDCMGESKADNNNSQLEKPTMVFSTDEYNYLRDNNTKIGSPTVVNVRLESVEATGFELSK